MHFPSVFHPFFFLVGLRSWAYLIITWYQAKERPFVLHTLFLNVRGLGKGRCVQMTLSRWNELFQLRRQYCEAVILKQRYFKDYIFSVAFHCADMRSQRIPLHIWYPLPLLPRGNMATLLKCGQGIWQMGSPAPRRVLAPNCFNPKRSRENVSVRVGIIFASAATLESERSLAFTLCRNTKIFGILKRGTERRTYSHISQREW